MKIKNQCHSFDKEIREIATKLLLKYNKRINPNLIEMHVVNCVRGRAYWFKNIITVPQWAYREGEEYFTYYVAHELSHIISWRKFHNRNHDKYFYEVFKKLCPEDIQFYELRFKKRSGVSFGVKGDLEKALKFKFSDNYKK
jgi:predicted metal-dependent hydrolase